MAQKLNIKPEEFTPLLINALVKNSLVDGSVIDELLKNRDRAVDLARKQIQGTCYLIDYTENNLRIFDTYTREEFHAVPLPGKPREFNPDDFDGWGS